jgi:T5SS/PEP-CTERM-associated repeat protein
MKRFFPLCAIVSALMSGASAQFTNILDNATTQTVNTVWTLPGTNIWVGSTTSTSRLVIEDGGIVTNASGIIGAGTNTAFNSVLVGTNGSWVMTGDLTVGEAGSTNILEITGGGSVSAQNAVVGSGTNAVGNFIVVTGSNSTLQVAETLTVGENGSGNILAVSSGGFLQTSNAVIGGTMSSTGNTVSVQDQDSRWVNSGQISIGGQFNEVNTINGSITTDSIAISGSNNVLAVAEGGRVTNVNSFIGFDAGDFNNLALADGSGAYWLNTGMITIGGVSNGVIATAGGTIEAAGLSIGASNTFTIVNDGTLYLRNDFDAGMTGFVWNAGGHLALTGDLTGMTTSSNGVYLDAGRDLTLNGGTWTNGGNDLIVGYNGSGSFTAVTNGGFVENENGYIGYGTNSAGNLVLVADTNSLWRNSGGLLQVGTGDGGNDALTVSNGAWVAVGEITTNDIATGSGGGIMVGSTNTAQLLVGNSSDVETSGMIYIGGAGGSQTGMVSVSDGGTITTDGLVIENGSGFDLGDGGTLVVTDDFNTDVQTNLNWLTGGYLSVEGNLTRSNGLSGVRRTLAINGGSWAPAGDLDVSGLSNNLYIANGGGVTNGNAYVGAGASDSNNTVWVWGDGSVWQNNGELVIGSAGTNAGNVVRVQDGGRIEVETLTIYDGNSFDLENGGTLAITTNFNVGVQSNLDWNAGGRLSVAGNLLGMETVSNVAGHASVLNAQRDLTLHGGSWLNGSDTNIIIGYNSSNSGLLVTNGATVTAADTYIGWGSSAGNNSVLVTGSNSTWTSSGGDLFVGAYLTTPTNIANSGGNNSFRVADQAWVTVGEVQTNLTTGGMLVASTNGARLVVGDGRVTVDETLYLGLDATTVSTNSIRNNGRLTVGNLMIADGSALDLLSGGTFRIETNFNASTTGFNWNENSRLEVGGILTGMFSTNLVIGGSTNSYEYLSGGRDLEIDGGSWAATNLVVGLGEGNSQLVLDNEAVLNSGTTYLGYGTNNLADNNLIDIAGGSVWTNSGDLLIGLYGSDNWLRIQEGSTNLVGGSVTIGSTNTSGNYAWVEGTNSLWNIEGDLNLNNINESGSVGDLQVYDAAAVMIGGNFTVNSSNTVILDAGGSIAIEGDMAVSNVTGIGGSGTISFGAADNELILDGRDILIGDEIVFDGGAGADTVNVLNGLFTVGDATSNQYVNFETLELNDSELAGHGTLDAATFGAVEMTGGIISPSNPDEFFSNPGTLRIGGSFSAAGTLYTAEVFRASNDLLIIDDTNGLDLATLDLGVYVPVSQINTNIQILEAAAGFGGSAFASTNIHDRMLLYDVSITNDATGVYVRAEENGTRFSSALTHAGSEGVRAGFNGMKNAVFTRTKQLRRNLVSTAHSIPQEAYLMLSTNGPSGPMGPGDQNTIFDMHIWMQHFSGQGDFDGEGASYGFSLNNSGTTIGFDRLFGESLMAGFNYTYARADVRTSNNDSLDSETYWLGLYGEWVGKEGLYVDTLAAVGRSNYDSVRREQNYVGTADYRGHEVGGYVDVGQYYHYKNFALTPYAGLHLLAVAAEEHTETEEAGSTLQVEEEARSWVESALGLKARHRFDSRLGRFQTTGYAEWTHDFVQDEVRTVMSANNLPPVSMAEISPDPDTVNAGLGLSWICTDYMEIGIGYNGRFSERYEEHSGSLMFDIMF